MDSTILKAILLSCEDAIKSIENFEEYNNFINKDVFIPISDTVLCALVTSFSNILYYKVSKEAYQRYSVRLQVIEILRELCCINENFQPMHIFKNEENTLRFVNNVINKHLLDILNDCTSTHVLTYLTGALMCLSKYNNCFLRYVKEIITRLSYLNPIDESEQLLCYVVHKSADLKLNLPTIERIYFAQRYKLIEEILLDYFTSTCLNINTEADMYAEGSVHSINELLQLATISPFIFQLLCCFLKELYIHLEYAPMILTFIQNILKCIVNLCKDKDKDVLDLYPRYLHSCILLLRIKPHFHTSNSKAYLLKAITQHYKENGNDILILLSHFPIWLTFISDHLTSCT